MGVAVWRGKLLSFTLGHESFEPGSTLGASDINGAGDQYTKLLQKLNWSDAHTYTAIYFYLFVKLICHLLLWIYSRQLTIIKKERK